MGTAVSIDVNIDGLVSHMSGMASAQMESGCLCLADGGASMRARREGRARGHGAERNEAAHGQRILQGGRHSRQLQICEHGTYHSALPNLAMNSITASPTSPPPPPLCPLPLLPNARSCLKGSCSKQTNDASGAQSWDSARHGSWTSHPFQPEYRPLFLIHGSFRSRTTAGQI